MISENIWTSGIGSVLTNIFPSNIFSTMLFLKSFHQNCQAVLTAVNINGLNNVEQGNSLTG